MKRMKTNTFGARVLSGLLSVLMVLSACPVTASADYEEQPEATTITVEDSEVKADNEEAVAVTDDSQTEDENVTAIPADEDAEDQTNPDVAVPPDIDDTSEETISETTTETTTEKTTDATTTESTTEASEETTTTEEKELPVVEFDHYFTDIDESLIETSELIVTTKDASVFTKNTNVVSNFDDAYIIACESVQEAKYVYSYYADKVDTISDLSKVISVATDENDEDVADLSDINDGNDALSNLNDIGTKNYADYIALIDTGAEADANFSVIGDDTSDSTGHGTKMLNLIKAENPDAKVMSIKVFNGNKTDAASVYAGIKLAIESNVAVINLSLVGSDIEKNAIVNDVIQEAISKNITVIGAAGNYNVSAKKFIPGGIDGAIIIGAANADGSKYTTSNTDADYYVVAESTSEATAIYTGLYTAGKLDDKRIFNNVGKDTSGNVDKPDTSDSESGYIINEDGSITFYWSNPDYDSYFKTAATEQHSYNADNFESKQLSSMENESATTVYGKCNFKSISTGYGIVNNFEFENENAFSTIYNH